jgi:hypothetical protein
MDKIPCLNCGLPIPDMPENATLEELLCNKCYEDWSKKVNGEN